MNCNAVLIAKIATGEAADEAPMPELEGKHPAQCNSDGEVARPERAVLSKKRRAEIAQKLAKSRWKNN